MIMLLHAASEQAAAEMHRLAEQHGAWYGYPEMQQQIRTFLLYR